MTLKFVFLTHGHADHIGALQEVRNHKEVPVYIGKGDVDLIANSRNNLSMFLGKEIIITSPEHIATDGEVINFAGVPFKVIETPGHTPAAFACTGRDSCSPEIRCFVVQWEEPIFTAVILMF